MSNILEPVDSTTMASRSNTVSAVALVLVITVIFSTIASSSEILPGMLGNIIAVLSYIALGILVIYGYSEISLPRLPLAVFLLIYTIFLFNALRIFSGHLIIPGDYIMNDSGFYLIYMVTIAALIIGSFITVFIIPSIISRDVLFPLIGIIAAISIIIGLPAYIIGDYRIGWVNIHTYTNLQPFREFGIFIPAMASYFSDANPLSKIALAGLFTSSYIYVKYHIQLFKFLIGINAIGLFLANSRTALIAAVIGATTYFIYITFGKRLLRVYITIGGVVSVIGFFSLVFVPEILPSIFQVDFSGRLELWRGTIQAILRNPIFGAGVYDPSEIIVAYTSQKMSLAPQNSYLRVFVTGGAISGFMYIGLLTLLLYWHILRIEDRTDALMFALFVSFLIINLTDTSNPFGINKNSMIFGFILGYILRDIYFAHDPDLKTSQSAREV